ncbi:MAG: DUF2127 domain-containing protein [Solirubrobacteraceae bacterium]
MAGDTEARKDRLIPWIAAERALRALVLVAIGIVLLTHPHANWSQELSRLGQRLGLDPKSNWVQRILKDAARIKSSKNVLFGTVALGYAALEGAEAYGLWRRRRWGEWLTVVATSLLLIPEVWELTKSTTALKVGALLVNIAVVLYLLHRLGVFERKQEQARPADSAAGDQPA